MISDDTLIRVARYTDNEVNEALDDWENKTPRNAIREELGGDYFYKCPWMSCNATVKRSWVACPMCGQKLMFDD